MEVAVSTTNGWLQNILLSYELKVARKISKLKTKSQKLAVEQLHAIATTSREIALERSDRSFRPIREDEVRELLEAADKAELVWLFVFEPNDLMADYIVSIAAVK